MDQYVLIKDPALNSFSTSSLLCVDNNNIINIQLLYDSNKLMEPKLWDGNFHFVLLYRSLEHLISNVKSIKKSIAHIVIYIKN